MGVKLGLWPHFINIPAIAIYNFCYFIFSLFHNMFQPLRAIFRLNTTSFTFFEVPSITQRIRCSLIVNSF
jgi:hypothetical protein